MKQNLINDVIQGMLPYLNNAQVERLQAVLQHTFFDYDIMVNDNIDKHLEQDFVELFLSAKRIEGCSEKSLNYYEATIRAMINDVEKEIKHIQTDDIRRYLAEYQTIKNSSRVTSNIKKRNYTNLWNWWIDGICN